MTLGKTARIRGKSLIIMACAAFFSLGLSTLSAQYGYQSIISTTSPLITPASSLSASSVSSPSAESRGVAGPLSEQKGGGGFSDYSIPQKEGTEKEGPEESKKVSPTEAQSSPKTIDDLIDEISDPSSETPFPIRTASVLDIPPIHLGPAEDSVRPSVSIEIPEVPAKAARSRKPVAMPLDPAKAPVAVTGGESAPGEETALSETASVTEPSADEIFNGVSTVADVAQIESQIETVAMPATRSMPEAVPTDVSGADVDAALPDIPDYVPVTLTSGKIESSAPIHLAAGTEQQTETVKNDLPTSERLTPGVTQTSAPTELPISKPAPPLLPISTEAQSPVSSTPKRVAMADADPPRSGMLSEQTTADGILPPPNDYQLTQDEAELLNRFLEKWEEFGRDIKKVSCSVSVMERDGGLYGKDKKTPLSHTFGKFRFISPNKLSYHIEGEFIYDQGASSDKESEPEYKKGSSEMKFVCDGRSWTEYDFKNRVAVVTPIPESQWNQDLTVDGPFPLFFIAKADNLKRRFYLKIVTKPERQDKEVWIEAWPRQSVDAQSFQRIIVTLRLSDLQPYYMRKYYANGKSYSELWFKDIAINKGLWNIDSKVDFGWKREVREEPSAANSADKASTGEK